MEICRRLHFCSAAARAIRVVVPALIEASAIAALACCLAWRPLGFIVPGAIVMTLSIYADVRRSSATRSAGETKP
jgi:hypothetical protein